MNEEQADLFFNVLLGWKEIGVVDGEPVEVPRNSEMRAFLIGHISTPLPSHPWRLLPTAKHYYEADAAKAVAAFLRQAADYIDPLAVARRRKAEEEREARWAAERKAREDARLLPSSSDETDDDETDDDERPF